MRRLRIGYHPYSAGQSGNPYVDRMVGILSTLGEVKPFPSVRELYLNPFSALRNRFDFLFINWTENVAFNRSDGELSIIRLFIFRIYILVCHLVSRKVIWIRHNNHPHHAKTHKAKDSAKKVLDHIESSVDVVITHSPLEVNEHRHYVPHPLYQTRMAEVNPLKYSKYYFIFGRMEPYKKLEYAIMLIPNHINLVIAGPADDPIYFNKCKQLAGDKPNVTLMPGFLDSATAARIANDSCGLIVLNADTDMVVSGSYIYALSLSVPLYTVRTPFIEWVSSRLTGIYLFDSAELIFSKLGDEPQNSDKPDPSIVIPLFGDIAVLKGIEKALGL